MRIGTHLIHGLLHALACGEREGVGSQGLGNSPSLASPLPPYVLPGGLVMGTLSLGNISAVAH